MPEWEAAPARAAALRAEAGCVAFMDRVCANHPGLRQRLKAALTAPAVEPSGGNNLETRAGEATVKPLDESALMAP